jgi:hypothetical protein
MASHKFTYTVSGFELTDTQKAKISQGIAAVVAQAVLGESAEKLQPELLTRFGIAGGRMIDVDSARSAPEAFISGGCGEKL